LLKIKPFFFLQLHISCNTSQFIALSSQGLDHRKILEETSEN